MRLNLKFDIQILIFYIQGTAFLVQQLNLEKDGIV